MRPDDQRTGPFHSDSPPTAPSLPAAEQLPAALVDHPRYQVLGLLGRGGMGAVYLARHVVMDRLVALKVIRLGSGSTGEAERFGREIRAVAQMDHPNIVRAFDAEGAGDSHLLVMEHVEGTDLARLLAQHGPLPPAVAADYARQVAEGLRHAHERGLVHRDVKPGNLIVTPAGVVKILDFGLARVQRAEAPDGQITGSGVIMGTPDYLAPEQANHAHQADGRADLYSLGCTLYQMLSGGVPFPGGGFTDKLLRHAREEPAPLTLVPGALAAVVLRLMAKRPEDRYQTAAEVARALEPSGDARAESPPTTAYRRPKRRARRARRLLAVVLVAGCLGLAGIAGAFFALERSPWRGPMGELEVMVETDHVPESIAVSTGGKEPVARIEPRGSRAVRLPVGTYQLTLAKKDSDRGLFITPSSLTVREKAANRAAVTRLPPYSATPVSGPNPVLDFRAVMAAKEDEIAAWLAEQRESGFCPIYASAQVGCIQLRFNAVSVREARPVAYQQQVGMPHTETGAYFHECYKRNLQPVFGFVYGQAGSASWREISVYRAQTGISAWNSDLDSMKATLERTAREETRPFFLYPPHHEPRHWTCLFITDGLASQVKFDLAPEQVAGVFEQEGARGWRPIQLHAHRAGGRLRFVAVLVENKKFPIDWAHQLDLTEEQVSLALDEKKHDGLRPLSIASYGPATAPRYAVVWGRYRARP